MTNFEKITETPEALGEFLASLPVADGPWDGLSLTFKQTNSTERWGGSLQMRKSDFHDMVYRDYGK